MTTYEVRVFEKDKNPFTKDLGKIFNCLESKEKELLY